MRKLATLALVSFWSLSVFAADWQVVSDTKLGQLKLDKSSVTKEGQYIVAVLLYEFKELQRLTAPPNAAFNKRQDRVMVDCAHPALAVHSSLFFEDMKLASTFTPNVDKIIFNPAKPDTMALTVVQAVCTVEPKTSP